MREPTVAGHSRLRILVVVGVAVLAACSSSARTSTTTVEPSPQTTLVSDDTTGATGAQPPDSAPQATPSEVITTTSQSSVSATARAEATVSAALATLPDLWASDVSTTAASARTEDDIYRTCGASSGVDLSTIQEGTLSVVTLEAREEAPSGTFLPPSTAVLEARVLASVAVAEDAFGALKEVIGTEVGRECLARRFLGLLPPDVFAASEVTVEALNVTGADVGASMMLTTGVDGISYTARIDVVASRRDDLTVYGSVMAFDEQPNPSLLELMLTAALAAS